MGAPLKKPFFAGKFYSEERQQLIKELEGCFKHPLGPGLPTRSVEASSNKGQQNRCILAGIAPHAALRYSGAIAAHLYSKLAREPKPRAVVIVAPNHSGIGSIASVFPGGIWETPLGPLEVDEEIAKLLIAKTGLLDPDVKPFEFEHSVEVQLPFIKYIYGDVNIVPIVLNVGSEIIAAQIAEALQELVASGYDIVVVATTDWSHYVPYDEAYKRDSEAINAVLALDSKRLVEYVERGEVSMCGLSPVLVILDMARRLDLKPHLLKYATSGDVTGDRSRVVGYAAISFERV